MTIQRVISGEGGVAGQGSELVREKKVEAE